MSGSTFLQERIARVRSSFLSLVAGTRNDLHGPILRSAFDPMLLLARVAVAFLLAGCVLAWTCRTFRTQGSRRFQWIMVALVLPCLVVESGYGPRFGTRSKPLEYWIEPVGRLPYETGVVDLAVKDRSGDRAADIGTEPRRCGGLAVTQGSGPGGNRRLATAQAGRFSLCGLCMGMDGETGQCRGGRVRSEPAPNAPGCRLGASSIPSSRAPPIGSRILPA